MTSLATLSGKYKVVLLGGVVALVVCGVSAVQGSRGWDHLQQLQAEQERLEALAFRMERSNEEIREHLRRMETDDAYIEQLARERLGWLRPGELVYRVNVSPGGGEAEGSAGVESARGD